MSGDFGLPAVLTTSTLDELLLRLDRAFYPVPTAGFVARWWVLTAVTIAYILLLFLCLGLHAKYSTAGFRGLWLIRRVERPSGRFLVLNSRLAWTAPAIYGLYELVYLVIFYRVHTHHMSQRAWFAVRSLNAPLIFVVGWLASWSGLQGFLVAIERNDERLVPAWVANAIFVAGGAILFTVDIGMAIATSILGIRFWTRFEDLRDALVAIKATVGDRVPTLVDFIPLQAPAQAFAEARKTWQSVSTVQYSFIALLPAACLLVNLGGLALARRLHTQIRDSIEVLAFVEARRTSTSRGIPLDNLSTPSKPRSSSPSTGAGMREQVDYIDLEHGPDREKEKRKQSLTTGEVKFLARQRDEQGEPVETQAHARKVLSLQKAMRDLVMVAATIAVITLAFLIDSILVAIWSRTHAIYKGHWPVTEAAVALPGWIYSVPVFVSACYLIYNTVAIGRLTAPPVSTYASGTAGMFGKSRGGGGGAGAGATTTVPFPSAGSVVSHFVDQARSASSTDPTAGADQSDELLSPALGERRRSSVVSVPKVTEQQTKRGSLGFPNWAGWKSGTRRTSGGTAGGKECRHGPGGGGGGERPNSLFSQGIVFTVETERVCEGDTCHLWDKEERRRKWLEGEREEGPFGEGQEEEGRRSPLS